MLAMEVEVVEEGECTGDEVDCCDAYEGAEHDGDEDTV
jgi:hypothetical protein